MKTMLPEVVRFLANEPIKMYVGGRWQEACSGKTFVTRDPGTGRAISAVTAANESDIDRAVEAAHAAFHRGPWSSMPVNDRAALLHRLADLVDANAENLIQIESIDVGKPVGQASWDISNSAQTLRFYADLVMQTRRREPIAVSGFEANSVRQAYGPCGFIFPWNFPFLLCVWGVSPALAAGNTVVIKPAEDTPLSTLYFAHLAEQAGIPPGVINVVPGLGETAGAALARHPGIKRMSFTGSPEVGRLVGESCGRNIVPVKLELGGKGAAILFEDADVERAAEELAAAVTLNAGQVCCTATRWLVHDKIRDRFLAKATSDMAGMKVGYGSDPSTQVGPVVSDKQRTRVLSYIEKGKQAGAETILDGGATTVSGHEHGFYIRPTILGGSPDNVCARNEIFGPVAYVMPFRTDDEAIGLVNESHYGLANSVWTDDLDRANRVAERLVAGSSWINGHNIFVHGVPYAGCNLSGCGGGVLGTDTLEDYFRKQSIVRRIE